MATTAPRPVRVRLTFWPTYQLAPTTDEHGSQTGVGTVRGPDLYGFEVVSSNGSVMVSGVKSYDQPYKAKRAALRFAGSLGAANVNFDEVLDFKVKLKKGELCRGQLELPLA